MLWMLAVAVAIAGCLAALYLDGRRDEEAVRREWVLRLTPRGRWAFDEVKERIDDELALADLALRRAGELIRQGSPEEALDVLDAGCALVERFSSGMRSFLSGLSVFSRMASVTAPVAPLRAADFGLGGVARLASLVHAFLVTGAERYRLRAFVLRRGFDAATRRMLEARLQLSRREGSSSEAWSRLEAARLDLHKLSEASLESFRTLLFSLSAERKEAVARRVPDSWGS
jgi:DNA-binding MarR family transcriptional regulator